MQSEGVGQSPREYRMDALERRDGRTCVKHTPEPENLQEDRTQEGPGHRRGDGDGRRVQLPVPAGPPTTTISVLSSSSARMYFSWFTDLGTN